MQLNLGHRFNQKISIEAPRAGKMLLLSTATAEALIAFIFEGEYATRFSLLRMDAHWNLHREDFLHIEESFLLCVAAVLSCA